MNELNELIVNLRYAEEKRHTPVPWHALCGRSADAIEKLTEEIEEWSQKAFIEQQKAIENMKEVERLNKLVSLYQNKLCDWCAVCPKERRDQTDCELIGETPVMYYASGAKMDQKGECR